MDSRWERCSHQRLASKPRRAQVHSCQRTRRGGASPYPPARRYLPAKPVHLKRDRSASCGRRLAVGKARLPPLCGLLFRPRRADLDPGQAAGQLQRVLRPLCGVFLEAGDRAPPPVVRGPLRGVPSAAMSLDGLTGAIRPSTCSVVHAPLSLGPRCRRSETYRVAAPVSRWVPASPTWPSGRSR